MRDRQWVGNVADVRPRVGQLLSKIAGEVSPPREQGNGHSGSGESARQRRTITFADADYGTYGFSHPSLHLARSRSGAFHEAEPERNIAVSRHRLRRDAAK